MKISKLHQLTGLFTVLTLFAFLITFFSYEKLSSRTQLITILEKDPWVIGSKYDSYFNFDQIIERDILNLVKPEKFLFSPGITFGDVEGLVKLVKGNKNFEDMVGYQLEEFKMLHDMGRQYLIYRRK